MKLKRIIEHITVMQSGIFTNLGPFSYNVQNKISKTGDKTSFIMEAYGVCNYKSSTHYEVFLRGMKNEIKKNN